MTRWAGIDYGRRRIWLALGDPGGKIASPAAVLGATGDPSEDVRQVLRWAAEHEAEGFVVGLPLNMNGSLGPQAQLSQDFADQLRRLGALPVELWDERLSSFQADELMRSAGLTPAKRKRLRDALAAQVILQSFLDAGLARQEPPEA
ncbi:MAG: Holliday junction resolvase RuvX [Planctomycetes bacterium]|nr:Holliday junction resolvase RuvX [Planctomycetota bacterium]